MLATIKKFISRLYHIIFMQTPLCEICLKSDVLCHACQEKLDKGLITKDEVEVVKYIYKLSDKMKSIRDVKIFKVSNSNALIIITGRGDAPKLVGKSGAVVKKIAQKFKRQIRIMEEASTIKGFVEELIFPTTINGINTLYRGDEEILRIRVPDVHRGHLLVNPDSFARIVSDFYNKKAELVFES
jgi:transcription antitermination factor NusA-like protein